MDASCQCRTITFKTPLPEPLALYICHCLECRHQSSSAFGCSAKFPKFPLPCKEMLSCYSCVSPLLLDNHSNQKYDWDAIPSITFVHYCGNKLMGSRRPTDSGNQSDCYFCKKCGSRILHASPNKDTVSVKGGCIEGLDWTTAIHIWCKRAGKSATLAGG